MKYGLRPTHARTFLFHQRNLWVTKNTLGRTESDLRSVVDFKKSKPGINGIAGPPLSRIGLMVGLRDVSLRVFGAPLRQLGLKVGLRDESLRVAGPPLRQLGLKVGL